MVKKYLQAEKVFVLKHINPKDKVLELGCGYGRVLQKIHLFIKVIMTGKI